MKHENGFHFIDCPCPSGKPDSLVIILPGHANHPDMFRDLAKAIHDDRPNTDVIIVRAPEKMNARPEWLKKHGIPHADAVYTWHKLSADAGESAKLVLSHFFNKLPVIDRLNAFADAQLKKRGLGDDRLALFGFSLGGAVAVQMATRRPQKCAAVISHSAPIFPIVRPKSKPDTLLLMGDQDSLFYTRAREVGLPRNKVEKAFSEVASRTSVHYDDSLKRLLRAGIPASGEVIAGLAHTVSDKSFSRSLTFMAQRLKP